MKGVVLEIEVTVGRDAGAKGVVVVGVCYKLSTAVFIDQF